MVLLDRMIFVRRADSDSWENFTISGTLGTYGPFKTNIMTMTWFLLYLGRGGWVSPSRRPNTPTPLGNFIEDHRSDHCRIISLWFSQYWCFSSLSSANFQFKFFVFFLIFVIHFIVLMVSLWHPGGWHGMSEGDHWHTISLWWLAELSRFVIALSS